MNSATFIAKRSLPLSGQCTGMGAGFAGLSANVCGLNSQAGDHSHNMPPGEASA
ncbi:hypothetical protein LRH25_08350 [Ideonella azotifigens]|uniref:hypothetical protein n=1 Tax=Ideonella azotifigens TaxID=513160 RepID=UPI001E2DE474|nr:hypothetical protein [Ideonella azotifigens]MCD2340352.1 hypothetical protein [Ideonella azotifigens]